MTAVAVIGHGLRREQTVMARRQRTAQTRWSSYVAVGDFEGWLHLLSQVDGSLAARQRVHKSGLRATMLQVDQRLYVYDIHGRLAAHELQPRRLPPGLGQ